MTHQTIWFATIAGSSTTNRAISFNSLPSFTLVKGFVIDPATSMLYLSEKDNTHQGIVVRKISVASQTMTTLAGNVQGSADGIGTNAMFRMGAFLALSPTNGHLYVSDYGNNRIKQIVIATQAVTTLAGIDTQGSFDATGTDARFTNPSHIAADSNGQLFVADMDGKLRKIVISTRAVTTLATFSTNGIMGLTMGASGPLYAIINVNFGASFVINSIHTTTGTATPIPSISVHNTNFVPDAFALHSNGNMFITERSQCGIRQYDMTTSTPSLTTTYPVGATGCNSMAIDGFGANIKMRTATFVAVDSTNGIIYLFDDASNRIRMLQAARPCTAGKYCPPSSSVVDEGGACPAGYWCLQGMDRIGCPAGTYCTGVGLATVPATFPSCSAGFYCPIGSSALDQGGLCPGGYYCRAGADRAACSAGQYCPSGSSTLNQGGICDGGYLCASGAERIVCPAGKFCTIGTASPPQPCSAGSYCPAGSSTLNQGGVCPGGSFCAAGTDRANCTTGMYCAPGSDTLDAGGVCPAGFQCLAGVDRAPCAAGFACTGGTARAACAPGSYAAAGSSTCTQCPRGLVTANSGKLLS
jgi:DNA-binding beta-propeller fold protein YncE